MNEMRKSDILVHKRKEAKKSDIGKEKWHSSTERKCDVGNEKGTF